MGKLKILQLVVIVIVITNFILSSNNSVAADDDFDEKYEHDYRYDHKNKHEDERYEEIGELIGWCIVFVAGAAGLLFPMRRTMKSTITAFPKSKQFYRSIVSFLGKYHIFLGVTALILGLVHGVLMYLYEGKLDDEGITGLVSVLLVIIAAVNGAALSKNRKNKRFRTLHIVFVTLGIVLAAIHILG